jgi:hypothetical protein
MKNELRVRVVEHIPEEHVHPRTRQREPYRYEGPGTLFQYDHERIFQEPIRLDPPRRPLPFDVKIVGDIVDVEIKPPLVEWTVVGNPPNPPVVTSTRTRDRSRLSAMSDGDAGDGDARAPLVGPELVYPLSMDLSEASGFSWLPGGSRLSVFGRACFGAIEVYGVESDMVLISAGPQLLLPFVSTREFVFGASLSAGPAWLETDIGSALGFQGLGALRGEVPLSGGLSFVAMAEAGYYASENVRVWGPGFSLGLTLSW